MDIPYTTDYDDGWHDYWDGFPPIPDYDPNNPEDVAYMNGYNDAMRKDGEKL